MVTQVAIKTARQALKVIPKKLADKPVLSMTKAELTRVARALGETAQDVFEGEGSKIFTQKGKISKLWKTKILEEMKRLGLNASATFRQIFPAMEKDDKAFAAKMKQYDIKIEKLHKETAARIAELTGKIAAPIKKNITISVDNMKAAFAELSKKFPQMAKDIEKAQKAVLK